MPHIIRARALSRRSFLRGAGCALALPWLDAMQPALRRSLPSPVRSLFVFAPNGVKIDDWKPGASGGGSFDLSYALEPLAELRREITVFSGFAIDGGRAHGDGPGDHARAASSFLTCAHPVKTGGSDIHVGVSIDQTIAAAIGTETMFPSLELGLEGGRTAGVCDSGYSCAYSNNIAWRTPSTPVVKEDDPRAVFERLFGDPIAQLSREDRRRERRRLGSVLDAVGDDMNRLRRNLSAADRAKLDEYADAVREIENRLARLEQDDGERREEVSAEVLERYQGDGFPGRLRLMFDLITLAFETDRTRVVTLMLGNGGCNRSYRFLDVPEGHHELSHHGRNPEKLDKIRRIDRFHVAELARFLDRLQRSEAGAGTLLDASMILYGSGISDGNRHNHDDLPILLAGRAAGRFRPGGRHLVFERETPLANLYLTMLDVLGVRQQTFADADGRVAEIVA